MNIKKRSLLELFLRFDRSRSKEALEPGALLVCSMFASYSVGSLPPNRLADLLVETGGWDRSQRVTLRGFDWQVQCLREGLRVWI